MVVAILFQVWSQYDVVKMLVYAPNIYIHERFCFLVDFLDAREINDDENGPHNTRKEKKDLKGKRTKKRGWKNRDDRAAEDTTSDLPYTDDKRVISRIGAALLGRDTIIDKIRRSKVECSPTNATEYLWAKCDTKRRVEKYPHDW